MYSILYNTNIFLMYPIIIIAIVIIKSKNKKYGYLCYYKNKYEIILKKIYIFIWKEVIED
jgi:hypothetical protein